MHILLKPYTLESSPAFCALISYLDIFPTLSYTWDATRTHIMLSGDTSLVSIEALSSFPVVARIEGDLSPYPVLHTLSQNGFLYQGIQFSASSFHSMIGLCAVDTLPHVESVMQRLQQLGQVCTRMGAYKPRTSPHTFRGHGKSCLPYVFELAGKYGIRAIAIEVLEKAHIEEITEALARTGNPTGVILQIGTRNCQNYALLQAVGEQNRYPVLIKRGYGISLHESLMSAEYIAHAGNTNIIFCLRGVKSIAADPHRNLVDFAHVPTIKRLTHMPVCVDPSHAVGGMHFGTDRLSDIHHAAAQGVIAGANLLLVDCHPDPQMALVDGHQALHLSELETFIEDMDLVRQAYLHRCQKVSLMR